MGKRDVIHKPEVYNIFCIVVNVGGLGEHVTCHVFRISYYTFSVSFFTEPQPQVTPIENLLKYGRVIFEISELTDRQTR